MPRPGVIGVRTPESIVAALAGIATAVAEQPSVVYRQVIYVALARGWTLDELRSEEAGTSNGVVRVELLHDGGWEKVFERVGGRENFTGWYRGAAIRFVRLWSMGDRSLLDLNARIALV